MVLFFMKYFYRKRLSLVKDVLYYDIRSYVNTIKIRFPFDTGIVFIYLATAQSLEMGNNGMK